MEPQTETIRTHLNQGKPVWLFLDYDGTLSDFAPTPDHIVPKTQVVNLITRLSHHPQIRVSVLSGRRLDHVKTLVPVSGILLAGTYGIEVQTPRGDDIYRYAYQQIRPVLDRIKPRWEAILAGRDGFYLEDKGWSLAIHARFAEDLQADLVFANAMEILDELLAGHDHDFRILGGHKFLEVGPHNASKGEAVRYLLENFPLPDALLIVMGDDDKDEEAFEAVKAAGGIAILVASQKRPSHADWWLKNPQEALTWLNTLLD